MARSLVRLPYTPWFSRFMPNDVAVPQNVQDASQKVATFVKERPGERPAGSPPVLARPSPRPVAWLVARAAVEHPLRAARGSWGGSLPDRHGCEHEVASTQNPGHSMCTDDCSASNCPRGLDGELVCASNGSTGAPAQWREHFAHEAVGTTGGAS